MGTPLLDWAVASRPLRGERVSGDQHLVAAFPGGALVAVIDGLGHGHSAEAAARAAVEVLSHEPERPVAGLVARCDAALGRLRGVVMTLASFDAVTSSMTWIGVGNVEAALVRCLSGQAVLRERLLMWGGIIGQMPKRLRPATLQVLRGDVIVFTTDGIAPDCLSAAFMEDVRSGQRVETIANHILERHALERDDALVLVARYQGGLG